MDREGRDKGLIFLNEVVVDPGLDHMSAMQVIHKEERAGGTLVGFSSWCGGLPAPDANDNPLGYKFSWSPRGVVMAGKNPGRYLKDKKEIKVASEDLFGHFWPMNVEGVQFHPESVLTPNGPELMENFLREPASAAALAAGG